MEWKDGTMVYEEGELDSGGCAPNPKWAASQLAAYGVEVVMRSEKLRPILFCSEVLRLADIPYRIEPAMPAEKPSAVAVLVVEKPAEVEGLGAATEPPVPAGAPDPGVQSEAEKLPPQ